MFSGLYCRICWDRRTVSVYGQAAACSRGVRVYFDGAEHCVDHLDWILGLFLHSRPDDQHWNHLGDRPFVCDELPDFEADGSQRNGTHIANAIVGAKQNVLGTIHLICNVVIY